MTRYFMVLQGLDSCPTFWQEPGNVAKFLNDDELSFCQDTHEERAAALSSLVEWLKTAPPGSVMDGWYSATWIIVVDGDLHNDGGEEPFLEIEDYSR